MKFSSLILILLLALTSCGRKGPLDHPQDEKRPKFDHVVDEEPNLKFPNNMPSQAQPKAQTPQPIQSIPVSPNILQQNSSSNP